MKTADENANVLDVDFFQKAYKKLKSSAYYDKTNLCLRDRIARAESETDIDDTLKKLCDALQSDSWDNYEEGILSNIRCIHLPKKIAEESPASSDSDKKQGTLIPNSRNAREIRFNKDGVQTFIDMPVEGHILGVVWIMLIGWQLDKEYTNCYGNRIREKLYNELSGNVTFSPYLFEPYYQKYESWRDKALDIAQEHLKRDNVLITTLDFTRFYYSVDISHEFMESLLEKVQFENSLLRQETYKRINAFVEKVIKKYSKAYFCEIKESSERKILPIGFLPSNVLANECLHKFDNAILDGWNPIYYGRYVDDILIVEKVEKGSAIEEAYKNADLTFEKAFDHYVVNGDRWNGLSCDKSVQKEKRALFEKTNVDKDTIEYSILPKFTTPLDPETRITLQANKVKLFYFESGQSEALIKCFREKISKNKSEFRNMPEDDPVFQKDDYTEIYVMDQTGVNKLRDVNGLKLDKYELSKYLGKYQRISGIVTDKKEHQFVKDIKKIFDDAALIENYTLWERIITILFVNHYYDELFDFIGMIKHAIDKVKSYDNDVTEYLRTSLNECLKSGLARTLALYKSDKKLNVECSPLKEKPSETRNTIEAALLLSQCYLESRMFDKTLCAVWPELIFALSKDHKSPFDFTSYTETLNFIRENPPKKKNNTIFFCTKDFKYAYYPYLVTMAEISLAGLMLCIATKTSLECANNIRTNERIYVWVNYQHEELGDTLCEIKRIGNLNQHQFIKIGDEKFTSVNVAISSLKMADDNFRMARMQHPNRSYDRYQKIAFLVNTALKENANLLVMPEACTPQEWLSVLARTSARNNMAIITGVEHIFSGKNVYNLTAVILPYTDKKTGAQSAYIFYHSKNHFAPGELQLIRGNSLFPVEGNGNQNHQSSYELYNWNDFWFSVYCCYELTSIVDRSLFQSLVDAIIAVEWNHDINYYSNIIESLSRDVHCYCIQVNTSDYGDSRITQPTKTEKKDILRTKGGTNAAVLVGKIEIAKLREFQAKTYELQKDDSMYKPTPPNFNSEAAYKKLIGQMSAEYIRKHFEKKM